MVTAPFDIGTLITRTPDIHGGVPHIYGKSVTVRRIAFLCKQGLSAADIADEFGHLSLAEVHAALAYYYANQEEIENDLTVQAAESKRLEAEYTGMSK